MKRIKYFLFAGLMVFALSSCNSFLDKMPENTVPISGVDYTNLNNMYEPVSGVYRIAESENPGLVHWMDLAIRMIRGDDTDKGSSQSDQSTLNDIKAFHYDYASVQSFWGTNNYFNDYYGLILDCNSALIELNKFAAHIPAGDAVNQKLNMQYQGEVRFIRAFAQLMLVRVFGNVPIVTDNTQIQSVAKSTVKENLTWISNEMDFCIANLEDARPNQSIHFGAVTKYSADMLKAIVNADLAGNDNASPYWQTVLSTTNDIINSGKFSLYPDFYQLFKAPGKMCNESLFELQFTDFGTSSGDAVQPGCFTCFQGPRGDQHGSNINGWGFMDPSQAIVNFLKGRNDSIRLKTTVLFTSSPGHNYYVTPSNDTIWPNSDGDLYFNGKIYLPSSQMTPGRTTYGEPNNIRVLRYADALLFNAEAKIRMGQNGDAPLNLVRARVGLPPITGATLQNVLDERRAEFACEWWGERFDDLVRTGQAASVLPGFTAGQSEYIPIPQTQIDLNVNLK
jgi:hypothetical protein